MIANPRLLLLAFGINAVLFVIIILIRFRDEIADYLRKRRASAPVNSNLPYVEAGESIAREARNMDYSSIEKYQEKQKLAHTTFRDFVEELKGDYQDFPADPTQRMDVYVRMAKREDSIGGGVSAEGLAIAVKEAYDISRADEDVVKDEIKSLISKSKFFKKSSKLGDMQLYKLRK